MANVFIGWNDNNLAQQLKKILSQLHGEDKFFVGAESQQIRHLGQAALYEINRSDRAIILISQSSKIVYSGEKVYPFFSPNVFLELGYIFAKMKPENILIFLINISPTQMPTDVLGDRVIPITGRNNQYVAKKIAKEYSNHQFAEETPDDIFLKWHKAKELLGSNSSLLTEAEKGYILLHSIQSAFYYDELPVLEASSNAITTTNKDLLAIKKIVTLSCRHYSCQQHSALNDDFNYAGDNEWIKIIGYNYAALRLLKSSANIEKVIIYLKNALTLLEQRADSLYVALWKGYIYFDYARTLNFVSAENSQRLYYFEKSLYFRRHLLELYRLQRPKIEQSSILEQCFEQEAIYSEIAFIKHKYSAGLIKKLEANERVIELERDIISMMKRGYLWKELQTSLADYKKILNECG